MPLQVFVRDVNYLHKKTYGKVLGSTLGEYLVVDQE